MTTDRAAAALVCGLAPWLGASSGAAAEPSHTWLEHQRLAVFPMMSAGQLLACRIA